ncbi:transmembrane protein 214-B [Neocloeon triangulifer]|uniref:transmembrane protein 214-B n=1 Tax=Neocloeon triangulifer TaxID=2078957 RepID=UPI00286F62BD|nr:transmembrane protein 214-B [Neocloeon triangulifer]
MSYQWEVVGGGKKAKAVNGQQNNKLTKSEKKKFVENAPKAEDILPLVEVQTLYSKLDRKKKPSRDDSSESKQNNQTGNGKSAGKAQPEATKPPAAKSKKQTPSPAKSVKEESPEQKARKALKSVDVSEISALVESGKQQYEEEPSVWLRFLASSLTSKLTPVVWSYLNIEDLKSSILELCPGELKKMLTSIVKELDPLIQQAFYENCLSAIANDISKELKVDGWLLLIETLSHVSPDLAVNNLARYESIMVSYQNRPVVGKTLLWALGQAGMRNLAIGVKVWHAIYCPRSETKNYSKIVIGHFCTMIQVASTKSKNVADNTINIEKYRNFLQQLTSKPLIDHPLTDPAFKSLQLLAVKTISLSVIFEELFNQFEGSHFVDGDKAMKQVMEGLTWCLKKDAKEAGLAWNTILGNKSYSKAFETTYQLLKHIQSSWNKNNKDLENLASDGSFREGFESALKSVQKKCEPLQDNTKVPAKQCIQISQSLVNRLKKIQIESSSKMSGFPWKTANLILIIAISSIVAYDVKIHDGFEQSSTGIFLKNIGALHYGEIALNKTREYYQVAYKWSEKEIPPVWNKYGAPTWQVAREQSLKLFEASKTLALNISNWASETWPKVVSTIDEYAPGLTDKVAEFGKIGWQYTKEFGQIGYAYTLDGVSWVNKNAFGGQLSAEYFSQMSSAAYNASHALAVETYQWISQMVLPLKSNAVPPVKSS